MIDYPRLEAILREAGRIAMNRWPGAGNSVEVWDKGTNDPVCEADLEVDTFLKRELRALLPSAGWLSEESAENAERLDDRLVWVVDPIDGTRDFIRGRTGWAVSVALVSSGRSLIAALEAPAREESWRATAGRGATLNGEALATSRREQLVRGFPPMIWPKTIAASPRSSSPMASPCAPRWSLRDRRTCWPPCAGATSGILPLRP